MVCCLLTYLKIFFSFADVRNEKKNRDMLAYGGNLFRCTTGLESPVTQLQILNPINFLISKYVHLQLKTKMKSELL